MSKNTTPLIFFGTDDFSAVVLEALIDSGRPIKAVVTKPDSKAGRGRKLSPPKVKQIASRAGIKVLQPIKVSEAAADFAELDWAVLASYGQIIPQSILDRFTGGIVNIHPSLLPRYRGPSPIETAILNGDRETGVSLMKLTADMDAGPVYVQEKVALSPTANRIELYKILAQKGAMLLVRNLDNILSNQIEPEHQDKSLATYTKLLTKADGLVDWSKPAEQIEREVRAYRGWPKSRAKLKHYDVILTKVRVANSPTDGSLVEPCAESYLEIEQLVAPSGRTMSGADFIRGYLSK